MKKIDNSIIIKCQTSYCSNNPKGYYGILFPLKKIIVLIICKRHYHRQFEIYILNPIQNISVAFRVRVCARSGCKLVKLQKLTNRYAKPGTVNEIAP